MRKLFYIIFATLFAVSCGNTDYLKYIKKGDFETAEKKILKDYQNNPNDVNVCYAYYKLLSNNSYSKHDDYKAFDLVTRTYQLLKSGGKTNEKIGITEDILLNEIGEASERCLQNAITEDDVFSIEHFINTCSQYASESQMHTAIRKRNALEFNEAKEENTEASYQAFIDKRPDAEEVLSAMQLRDSAAYAYAVKKNTLEAYMNFVALYPNAKEASGAQVNVYKLAYDQAKEENTIESYQSFVNKFPAAKEVSDAQVNIYKLAYVQAKATNTIESYQSFVDKYPVATQAAEARRNIYKMAYDAACLENTERAFRSYLEKYPESEYVADVKEKLLSFDFFKSELTFLMGVPDEMDEVRLARLYGEMGNNGETIEGDYQKYYGDTVQNMPEITILGDAIEEVFFDFVSSDSTFLFDNIVQMTDPQYGIVRKVGDLEIVEERVGKWGGMMEVSVDMDKLIQFAREKGVNCDIVARTWDFEMRMYDFFKSNAERGMVGLIDEMIPWQSNIFDVSLVLQSPKPINGTSLCSIPIQFEYICNDRTIGYYRNFMNYLGKLAIPEPLVKKYKELGFEIYKYDIVDYSNCYFATKEPYDGKLMIDDFKEISPGTYEVGMLSSRSLYFYNELPEEDLNMAFAGPLFDFYIKNEGGPSLNFFFCEEEITEHFKRGFIDCCTPYGVWEKSKFGYVSNIRNKTIGLRLPYKEKEVLHQTDVFEIVLPVSSIKKITRMLVENNRVDNTIEEIGNSEEMNQRYEENLEEYNDAGIRQSECVERTDYFKIRITK